MDDAQVEAMKRRFHELQVNFRELLQRNKALREDMGTLHKRAKEMEEKNDGSKQNLGS